MITVLLAVPDVAQEAELVRAAPRLGVRVVRRCVDAVDLFAAAASDPEPVIIVSAGLPRLSRDAIDRMVVGSGRHVVGLAGDDPSGERLRSLGVRDVIPVAADPEETWRALTAAMIPGVWSTGCWADESTSVPLTPPVALPGRPGQVIAVWGPAGAPGRTTVAIGLAEALADSGLRVCLVDADTYGPSITMALGIVEDASGLVVACRHADNGSLTAETLRSACSRVRGDWQVLGGVGRPDRWSELRPGALEQVWDTCRSSFDVTVVDIGFCLEDAEAASSASVPQAWARRRNAPAVSLLTAADHVVAVADSTSLGAARIASAWSGFMALAQDAGVTVVQNRAPRRSRDRRGGWVDGLRRLGVSVPIHPVPSDAKALADCWDHGRSLAEGARRSPLRRSLVRLAGSVVSG